MIASENAPCMVTGNVRRQGQHAPLGVAVIWAGCCTSGFVVTSFLFWATDMFGHFGGPVVDLAIVNGIYLVIALPVGMLATRRLERNALAWRDVDRPPSAAEAVAIMHLPLRLAILGATLWLLGSVANAIAAMAVLPFAQASTAVLIDLLGALASAGLIFLLTDRALRSVVGAAARASPTDVTATSVMSRMVVAWAVSSGIPLLGLVVVLGYHKAAESHRIAGAWCLAFVGIGASITATAILARGVAAPLYEIRQAVGQIADGHLDARLEISSFTEIGLLQRAVNDMAAALRERDRLTELFGQHVGADVAKRAVRDGVDLTGDIRAVSVLFVDVVGSTELATRFGPTDIALKLNRLLADIVATTQQNGGLVNKFEGDGALCIFGAPTAMQTDATAALRTARLMRNAIQRGHEFDIGIGVSRGKVFAGDLGVRSRHEYTVVGDAVNEAARLTELAKAVPGRVLASGAVLEAAGDDERACWSHHAMLSLRGRSEPTSAWTTQPE